MDIHESYLIKLVIYIVIIKFVLLYKMKYKTQKSKQYFVQF